jgi:O-antigen/teichoic acid export membrane protein
MWFFRISDVRSYLGFGSALVANNIVNEINRNVDLILGGRMLAAAALGFYSLPRQLVFQVQNAVNPIITRVGFPLIAQLQDDIPKVRLIYLKTLNMTASTNAPLYLVIAFFSPEVTQLLLGAQWVAAADLLRLLAIWGFFRSIGNPAGSLLLGVGRADLSLKWNICLLCIVPPVLWMGSQFGAEGLAWALLCLSLLLFIPGWFFLIRPLCHAHLWEYSVQALRPLFISLISIFPAYYISEQIDNVFFHLVLGVIMSAPLYMLISYFANRDWVASILELIMPNRHYG